MENLCLMKCLNIVVLICGVFFDTRVFVYGEPQFSAMFVFGDSLIDSGNNNFLRSQARANFLPYGIDFPQGPTGRFTNGKTIIDFLAELVGLPYVPPYAHPLATGSQILYGVNYASAAGGILDESGKGLGERFSLRNQVENFGKNRDQLREQMSEPDLNQHLAKALALLILGSNDYINNYFNPSYPTRSKFKPDQYADILAKEYSIHITTLYNQGLRRFFFAGVGAVGCVPGQRTPARSPPGQCVTESNDAVQLFNTRLKTLVDQFNVTHTDATFLFGSTYDGLMEILTHPSNYGIIEVERACCGTGRNNAEKMCLPLPLSIPCLNRDQFAFWDAFHPTQIVHRILALMAYQGTSNITYPINLKQLSQL